MNESLEITVNCCLCSKKTQHAISLPVGWRHRVGIDSEQDGFCPDHAAIAEFTEAQCPGCVGGWGECDMWRSFAFSGRSRSITDADLAAIRKGVCPKRINGTFGILRTGTGASFEGLDLSNRASPESGNAFADAIEAYIKQYP